MNTSGVYFKVTQDINMKNTGEWRGIADNVTGGFRGHFDGANHLFFIHLLLPATACSLVTINGRMQSGFLPCRFSAEMTLVEPQNGHCSAVLNPVTTVSALQLGQI